jgi:dihydropteroate synthase
LLKSLDKFIQLHPTVVGLSRKSFIGEILNEGDPKKRLAGSLGASAFAVMKGAHIIRVHDVKETSDICKILTSLF